MQMSSRPASVGARLKPQWRPREENVEADDITSCRFDCFDLGLIGWRRHLGPVCQ